MCRTVISEQKNFGKHQEKYLFAMIDTALQTSWSISYLQRHLSPKVLAVPSVINCVKK